MIKYIVSAVVITLFLLADIYIFAVCGELIGFAMVAHHAFYFEFFLHSF